MLSGFADPRPVMRSVDRPLEANGILWTLGAERHLLVTVDLLYAGGLEEALRRELGLDSVHVLASHTHFAPAVDPQLGRFGVADLGYIGWVLERIATAARAAQPLVEPTLRRSTADTGDLFVNRRLPTLRRGVNVPKFGRVVSAPNFTGTVDRSLPIHRLDSGGRTRVVLWSAACHPVCFPHRDVASPCYIGRVRESIRVVAGDIPVLFIQGFSGNVRPNWTTRRPPRDLGKFAGYVLGGFQRFVGQSPEEYDAWTQALTDRALDAFNRAAHEQAEPWLGSTQTVEARELRGWERTPRLSRIDLTPTATIVAANAEVMSEQVSGLAAAFPGRTVLPASCAGEVIGYWPTDEILREGGYEGLRSATFFPPVDWSAAGGPDRLWESLIDGLADEAAEMLISGS